MIRNATQLFGELLRSPELRKIDFKRDQYLLDTETLKSDFVKDVLCMANAFGDDAYILLGVKAEKGRRREIVGISHHHDSSNLETIVNSVIEEPIQFEYYPVKYQGRECALIYIPRSKAKPHRPRKDYGKLKKHVFYTRRSSGNREASIQEIREMCIETMQISDIAHRKMRVSPHIVDELKDMSLDDRKLAMFNMLKRITKKIGLEHYDLIFSSLKESEPILALVNMPSDKLISEYAILMHPWTAKGDDILYSRRRVIEEPFITMRISPKIRNRVEKSSLVHISYKSFYTKALEKWPYSSTGYWFANKWTEPWGIVIKWEDKILRTKRTKYEFFLSDVSSVEEMRDRIEKLLSWVKDKIM